MGLRHNAGPCSSPHLADSLGLQAEALSKQETPPAPSETPPPAKPAEVVPTKATAPMPAPVATVPVELMPPAPTKILPPPMPEPKAVETPPVATVPPAAPVVPTKEPPEELTGDLLAIYNTHNWHYGGRGAKTCNVNLRLGSKVVWKKDDVAVAWDSSKMTNPKTTVSLPDLKYDIVRIEIVAGEGEGGGLAEIEVLRKGKNIALGKPVMASVIYNPDSVQICAPEMVNDGIVDESRPEAGDGKGYWLLPSSKPGWIEILIAGAVAPKRRAPRR